MKSILNMIDSSLEDILDPESYEQYKDHYQKYLKERKKERIIKRRGGFTRMQKKKSKGGGGSTAY